MEKLDAYVAVVGGGLAGLSAALFLAWQDVPVILLERHQGSSPHPRAIGFTARTLELLCAVGMGADIPEEPADFRLLRARIWNLAGKWFEQTSWHPDGDGTLPVSYSPCTGASLAQDRMEPLLRSRAVELGADIRFAAEMVDWSQDADGVSVRVRERDGKEYGVRASYMIAADGNRSPVRERLGIPMQGRGHMATLRSVLFRAPLDEYLKAGVAQFEIDQPELKAFLASYNDGRWALMFHDDQERDEETLRAAIGLATGRPDVPVEIITTGRWDLSASVAERFSAGRVFLAGDAAHTLPPSRGGYGANTGISDAHNLAWKLASVRKEHSTPALLDSYSDERQPVAWRRHQQIFARPDYKQRAGGWVADDAVIDDDAMEFGQLYRSAIIAGASEDLLPALRPDQWLGQPGTRAPHVWVLHASARVSTLDLFQPGWVLLAGNDAWRSAAAEASRNSGIPVRCLVAEIDISAVETPLLPAFGLGPSGAALIRPDGYIAWRTLNHSDSLAQVMIKAAAAYDSVDEKDVQLCVPLEASFVY